MTAQREWLEKDYYAVLGVSPSATDKDLSRAFKKLAKQLHPDANPGNAEAEERFKEISAAYDILSDPTKRAEYDEVWEPINETPIGAAHQPQAPNPDSPVPADTPPKSLLDAVSRLERAAASTLGSGRPFEFSRERFAKQLAKEIGQDEWVVEFANAIGNVLDAARTPEDVRGSLRLIREELVS